MKFITTLFLSSVLAFTALSQISTNGVYVQDGITTEVEKKVYEISPTNKPALLYFSNELIVRVNTNSEFIVNSFFQDVENKDTFPQVARFGLSSLNVTLLKGNALFKYPGRADTNASCVVSTPHLDVELYDGLFYIEVSDTKVIVAILDGSLKSYNGKKETFNNKGQAIVAEPNDVGILEGKIKVSVTGIRPEALKRLNDDATYLRAYENSLFFIRINGKTIAVDKQCPYGTLFGMRVPHEDKVIHQTFNANKIEFVWLFPDNKLFIFKIYKNGSVRCDTGSVNDATDWVNGHPSLTFIYPNHAVEKDMDRTFDEHNSKWDFFSKGKDLMPLIQDVMEYLK